MEADVEALRQDLASLRRNVEHLLAGLTDQGKETASRAVHAAEAQIKDRPFWALLVVFVVGLVLGTFARRH